MATPLACRCVRCTSRRLDSASSYPGRAHFSLPRRTCICALQTAAPQRCRKWNTCTPTAASRFSIRYRSAISSALLPLVRVLFSNCPSVRCCVVDRGELTARRTVGEHCIFFSSVRSSSAALRRARSAPLPFFRRAEGLFHRPGSAPQKNVDPALAGSTVQPPHPRWRSLLGRRRHGAAAQMPCKLYAPPPVLC
jgi:hypothetical protein